jgi:gluconate kinase
VTGAAASGKSTVCASLASSPGLLALDGDVLASGAAAVTGGRHDYPAFWRYLLDLAREVGDNGLATVYCCVCLPHQVLDNAGTSHFTGVHFLALVSDDGTVRDRVSRRRGADSAVTRLDVHVDINRKLREATVPSPHTITRLDTTVLRPDGTIAAARSWAAGILAQDPS